MFFYKPTKCVFFLTSNWFCSQLHLMFHFFFIVHAIQVNSKRMHYHNKRVFN